MASSHETLIICHLLLLVSLLHFTQCFIRFSSDNDVSPQYPERILQCKLFNETSLDCRHRQLPRVPVLLDNNISRLLIGHNNIANLTGTPFINVSSTLRILNLTYNVIHTLESSVFSVMLNLQVLDLSGNQIVTLPRGIFKDLLQLRNISINMNLLKSIPNQQLSPLKSIEKISLLENPFQSVRIGSAFQNLTKLQTLAVSNPGLQTYRARFLGTFQYLSFCRCLNTLLMMVEFQRPLPINIFEHLTHLQTLYVSPVFEFKDLMSLGSPIETLDTYPSSLPTTLSNGTLQPLGKWNSTLTELRLKAGTLRRIEGSAFIWIPLLRNLDLTYNNINYLSERAFDDLTLLEVLNLSQNSLSFIPYETFQVFRNSGSLHNLDLSSNQLASIESNWQFLRCLITPSLKMLNVDGNFAVLLNTSVLVPLENLTDVTIKIKDAIINSPPLNSLKTLHLQAYPSSLSLSPYSFQTAMCTFAPFLERALLPNIRIRIFADVIGYSCAHLIELDISGCLTEYTTQPSISLPNLIKLDMSNNKLTSLNQTLFLKSSSLLFLDLSNNDISTIGNSFEHLFQSLENLNLEGNKLTSMNGILTLTNLIYLNLARNHIMRVPKEFEMNTTDNRGNGGHIVTLDIGGNPFECTCDVEAFRLWIATDNVILLLAKNMYTCATPDTQKGRSLSEVVLDCRSRLVQYIGTSISGGLFVLVIAIFVVKYRWHIKYKMFLLFHTRRQWRYMDNEDAELDGAAGYDAYVAYADNCPQDTSWVINDIRPNMEEKQNLKLCIKDRDFIGGRDIVDEIYQNIKRSRKTLLILTPRFVESEWCHFEMRMAQMRLFDENRDVIILILLEEIPDIMLTMSLRQLLCDKELLKFPHDGLGQDLFWRRLKAQILEPVRVDRRYDV